MSSTKQLLWLACLGVLGATALPAFAQEDPFADAAAFYEENGRYPALELRAQAWERLAACGDARGIERLALDLRTTPGPYSAEGAHLLATALLQVRGPAAVEALERWVGGGAFTADPWAVHCALRALCAAGRPDTALRLLEDGDPGRQVAAALALARANDPVAAVRAATTLAEAAGREEGWRHLRACAAADALSAAWPRAAAPERRAAAAALIDLLDAPRLERRTAARLRTTLARLLGGDPQERDVAVWRARLDGAPAAPDADAGAPAADPTATRERGREATRTRSRPRFMTLTAEGQRVVYVLDLSDSMLVPLRPGDVERLRPLTGEGADDDRRRRIDWSRVRTRFDAARLFLELSLVELDPRTRFAVVVQGDQATTLAATPTLVPASRAAVQRALTELADLRLGPVDPLHPHGSLRGSTHLHAALRLAFRLTTGGVVPEEVAHAAPAAVERGADAVFVLSDGAPTRWSFEGRGALVDATLGGGCAFNPETGASVSGGRTAGGTVKVPRVVACPFSHQERFRRDLERLNLLRQVELHAVAIGEADRSWLRVITEVGRGRLLDVEAEGALDAVAAAGRARR